MEILVRLSYCIDLYKKAVEVFQHFFEAFGKDAFNDLGESIGTVKSINGLIEYPKASALFEEFLDIKADKIGKCYFAIKNALHDKIAFLLMVESMSKKTEETFVNWHKETKTISGLLFQSLKDFVEDPNTSMGHPSVPKIYSFNVDLETVSSSMLALISKLSEKDRKLTDKNDTVTIGEKLTNKLIIGLSNINNYYFFPDYTKGGRIQFTTTENDFKNLEFRNLYIEKALALKKECELFEKELDLIYYNRR